MDHLRQIRFFRLLPAFERVPLYAVQCSLFGNWRVVPLSSKRTLLCTEYICSRVRSTCTEDTVLYAIQLLLSAGTGAKKARDACGWAYYHSYYYLFPSYALLLVTYA